MARFTEPRQHEVDSLLLDTAILRQYGGRFYNPIPCWPCPCMMEQFRKEHIQESPYQFADPSKPIVLPDSIIKQMLKNDSLRFLLKKECTIEI